MIEIPLNLEKFEKHEKEIVESVIKNRQAVQTLLEENRQMEALERVVESLRELRDFSDYDSSEFKSLLVMLLFDLAEIHYALKDYKQSEKELEVLFRVLENLIKRDADRFGPYHVLALELSTRILRSRKKTLELLVKQQINAGALYDKVNSGVVAATDKLVDSLRNVGELLASTGDYRAALKFYSEAIKLSKKRAGRVTRKEVKMTVEMAKIMMRLRQMRPRARRLLEAVLPHAIALETIELEEDILALIQVIDADVEHEPMWKVFMHKVQTTTRNTFHRKSKALREAEKEQAEMAAEIEAIEDGVAVQMAEQEIERAEEERKDKKKNKNKNK